MLQIGPIIVSECLNSVTRQCGDNIVNIFHNVNNVNIVSIVNNVNIVSIVNNINIVSIVNNVNIVSIVNIVNIVNILSIVNIVNIVKIAYFIFVIFYTTAGVEILHLKVRKFATKVAPQQNSINFDPRITHCVKLQGGWNTAPCVRFHTLCNLCNPYFTMESSVLY